MRRFFLFGAALFGALAAGNVSSAQIPDRPAERALERAAERSEDRADRIENRAEERAEHVEDRAERIEDRAQNAADRPLLDGNVDVQAGPGGVNVDVDRAGRQSGPAGAGVNVDVDGARGNGPDANRWRYRWHNGAWWYWTTRNAWVIYRNGQWVPYETYVTTQPTYSGPGYSSGSAYYYDNSYYGPNYYGPRRYYSGYRGYYGPGYRGYYGRPIIRDPGARQGAVIGGTIGGAVGGREGAAIGAGVGAAVGRGR